MGAQGKVPRARTWGAVAGEWHRARAIPRSYAHRECVGGRIPQRACEPLLHRYVDDWTNRCRSRPPVDERGQHPQRGHAQRCSRAHSDIDTGIAWAADATGGPAVELAWAALCKQFTGVAARRPRCRLTIGEADRCSSHVYSTTSYCPLDASWFHNNLLIHVLADARCESVGSDGATGPRPMVFVGGFHLRGQSPGWLRQSAATFPYEECRL